MRKRIHILTAAEHRALMREQEPPYPRSTYFAVELGERWEIRQIINYKDTQWREQSISTHETREAAKQALIRLIITRKAIAQRPTAPDGRHYWLTPPDLMAQIRVEFGPNIFDPCPYPRPPGFNGLEVEWGAVNYVNPPFRKSSGGGIGVSDWVKKMLAEQKKGKTSVLVFPTYSWFHLLLNGGAEMRSLGQIKWLAIEDGSSQKASLPIVMFVLHGTSKRFPRFVKQWQATESRIQREPR
jgi:hypothetical protein